MLNACRTCTAFNDNAHEAKFLIYNNSELFRRYFSIMIFEVITHIITNAGANMRRPSALSALGAFHCGCIYKKRAASIYVGYSEYKR